MVKDIFRSILLVVSLVTLLSNGNLVRSGVPRLAEPQGGGGSINGMVVDPSGAVLAGAGISARNLQTGETRQDHSDAEGRYLLTGLAPGRYLLTVTAGRFQPASREVSVGAGRNTEADFRFSLQPLREWVDVSAREQSYLAPSGGTATRLDLPLREIPQSIQIINRKIIDDQQIFQLADIARNASGVTHTATDNNGTVSNEVAIRGFSLNLDNSYLRDGLRFDNDGNSETAHLEQVEVLKGPAAALYGRSEPGGVVNAVTKRPLAEQFWSVRMTGGSHRFYRPQVDLSGPLNSRKTVLYRFNGVFEDAGSFREFVDSRRVFLAPVVTWKVSEATALTVSSEYLRDLRVADFGVAPAGDRPLGVPISRSFGEPFNRVYFQQRQGDLRFNHRFNDRWAVQSTYRAFLTNWDFFEVFQSSVADDGRTVNRQIAEASFPRRWQFSDTHLTGEFKTGRFKHRPVTGFDLGYQKNFGRGPFGAFFPSIDAFQPTHPFTRQDAERYLADGGPSIVLNSEVRNRSLGGYVQDQVEITSKLKTLLGVRVDRYSQTFIDGNGGTTSRQTDVAASPRVGLVYQVAPAVSVYASFSRSFNPVSPTLRSSSSQTFDPERGLLYEAGVKFNSFNNRLLSTFSVFEIVKRNVLTADPNNPQFSVQSGKQRSKGVELDLTGTPMTGWNVLVAYAFTQPQVTADNVFPVGNLLANAARHSGNVWTTYEFNRSRIRGLGFGAGLQATSRRFGDLSNSFVLPGFARVDTSVFYTHNRNDRMSYKLSFNLNNLFNRTYYDASVYGVYINPGAPRAALVSLTMTRR